VCGLSDSGLGGIRTSDRAAGHTGVVSCWPPYREVHMDLKLKDKSLYDPSFSLLGGEDGVVWGCVKAPYTFLYVSVPFSRL
jgi:hypothetical protein